ncbi:TIGR02757 family protein [bacterium]|nr:MAG: TIGR02757 family protein [bacterium]
MEAKRMKKDRFDRLYHKYNRPEFVDPDPLGTIYRYHGIRDREIAALIASSLAYGKALQIVRTLSNVFELMPFPAEYLKSATRQSIADDFSGFRHRWTTGEEMVCLLWGIKMVVDEFGSLEACFAYGFSEDDENIVNALASFSRQVRAHFVSSRNSLLPDPHRGSACKRLNLFLRWLVREDDVDPGGWKRVSQAKLIIPLDTHMHRISRRLGFTKRKQADLKTALEVTRAFKMINPDDPVRYDFSLTRLGIRDDLELEGVFQ